MISLTKIDPEKSIVVKANNLIECPNPLNPFEHRIVLILLAYVYRLKGIEGVIEIGLDELRCSPGIGDSYSNSNIERILFGLKTKGVQADALNPELTIPWLIQAEVLHKHRAACLRVNPDLKPFLLNLTGSFTRYSLGVALRFQNKYAFRIYELLKQYQRLRVRLFELDRLRYLLGIEEGRYRVFKNLRNRVLLPVQDEINKKSDLVIGFNTLTRGRRVVGIRFEIGVNTKFVSVAVSKEAEQLINLLPEEHRQKDTVLELVRVACKQYGLEYVRRNILYTNKNSTKQYRGYLVNALKHDWGIGLVEDEKIQTEKQAVLSCRAELLKKDEISRQQSEKLKKEAALNRFYSLPESQQKEIEKKIELEKFIFKNLSQETKIWIWMENGKGD